MDLYVIIDMINGFVKEGALADSRILKIVPAIISRIKKAIAAQTPIVFLKDEHDVDDAEFKLFPPHCVKGTSEAEIIDELKIYAGNFQVIPKKTTDGFQEPAFRRLLEEKTYRKIYVAGCCTDICIQQFVLSILAYLKEKKLPTQIIVSENEVSTFDKPNHNALMEHNRALILMQAAGAKIATEGERHE